MSSSLRLRLVAALVLIAASAAQATPLLSLDFESPLTSGVSAKADLGTVDTYQGRPGHALSASDQVSTGRLPVANTETDLAKLTLGFDLHVATLKPVRVTITSFDAAGRRTGARTTLVVPPVAGSYYRFGVDLDKTQTLDGTFDPLTPSIEFTFAADTTLRIDNLSYTAPAFYVSPTGSDTADGHTPATAFATPQRAADAAHAGDVVLFLDGTYKNTTLPDISDVPDEIQNSAKWRPWWVDKTGGTVTIKNAGTPAAWIVFRAAPGQHPILLNDGGWHVAKIDLTASYIELRGLTLQGSDPKNKLADALADGLQETENGRLYHGAARFNSNGILVDGRPGKTADRRPHHLRFIDNTLFNNSGAGATIMGAACITLEGNHAYDNCHSMRYGASGLSTLLPWNWDADTVYQIFYLRNTCHGNRTDVPCSIIEFDAQGKQIPRKLTDRYSDGNGIIIDVNQNNAVSKHVDYPPFTGRTLVQNNLVYNNGGSGIHTVNADHVDIFHNTAYLNSASPHLEYSQIYTYASDDVRIARNILVAPVANLAAGEKPEPVNSIKGKNGTVIFSDNLYFGGNIPPFLGAGDRIGDPLFVNPSRDPAVADFHLRPGSPARSTDLGAYYNTP